MSENYWGKYWHSRRQRRAVLRGAGVATVGVAGLATVGCSGGDDDGGSGGTSLATPTAGAGATPTPSDPFANVTRGGIYRLVATGDPPTIDPMGNLSFATRGMGCHVYSRLYRYKTGPGIGATDVVPEGDLAESEEVSADGLTWTLKLRAAKFHNVAPVSGRTLNSDDIRYSWGRMMDEKNTNRNNFTFVDKVEYPDNSTVVFSLKTPNAGFKELLTDTTNLIIMPNEADGKFDPNTQMIGTGPWLFDNYKPSISYTFKRNPEWFVSGFPLMDEVEYTIIPEYATRLAQFLSGNTDTSGVNAPDLIDTKNRLPDMQLYGYVPPQASFLWFDNRADAPWHDKRVRQAVSMAIPRDDITDLMYETTKLKQAGIDVQGPWNNLIPAGMTRFWLDPQGPDIGDAGKYFKYDLAEAKKLLEAAGYGDGFPAVYQYAANRYGKAFNDSAEAMLGSLQELGIKTTTDIQDYASKYITQTFVGNFEGIVTGPETAFVDVGGYSARLFTDNPSNHAKVLEQRYLDIHAKQQQELDEEKRKALIWDLQRMNAEDMYYVPTQFGAGTSWSSHQGYMRNVLEFVTNGYGSGTETIPYRWKAV